MKPLGTHNYYVYITTNKNKTVLYTGVTGNLYNRITAHENATEKNHFTARYGCYNLVYWEHYSDINQAIAREKEIKGWIRKKKIELIETINPEWKFLNNDIA